jgi:DNA repair/transcription protein MET18/MMS19
VKETIDTTLDVLRAIARRLDGTPTHKLDVSLLQSYVDLVSRDCRDDLANATYTKQAGLLLMTVISANIRAYLLYNAGFIDTIRQNLRQPKSPSHTKDLLLLLNSLLKTRIELFRDREQGHPDDKQSLATESRTHLDTLFHDVYLPIWTAKGKEIGPDEEDVLKQVTQGLALLVSQPVLWADGTLALLCPGSVCSEICSLLTVTITRGLTLSSNDNQTQDAALEDEAVLALRTVVMHYTAGYPELADRVKADIKKRDWVNPSEYSLSALKALLSRFTFIGASEIPSSSVTDTPTEKTFSPLQHFITLTTTLLKLLPLQSHTSSLESTDTEDGSHVATHVVPSLHASIIWFGDAYGARYGMDVFGPPFGCDRRWWQELRQHPENWPFQQPLGNGDANALRSETKQGAAAEVYHRFLKLSVYIVMHLYRSAAFSWRGLWGERALVQLSQMAALVVRRLDEEVQGYCNLAHEAFNFFGDSERPSEEVSVQRHPLTGLLTLGILQGLRLGAVAGLVGRASLSSGPFADQHVQYTPGGQAEKFMCDTSSFGPSPSRESDIRAGIGAILANKYKDDTSASDSDSSVVIKRVLDFWGNWLTEAVAPSSTLDPTTFQAYNTIAMNVLAGLAARQDKHLLTIIPTLHQAAASPHPNGAVLAQSLGLIVKENPILTPANHTVVRYLYKQWAYSRLAKPLVQLAQPAPEKDARVVARSRAAVLSVVRNCPFTVYQDDLEPLIRLLVTALKSRAGPPPSEEKEEDEGAWAQVTAALEILVEILTHEPEALRGYLREVIGGVTGIYQECSPQKGSVGGVKGQAAGTVRATCRRLALQVLGAIPTRFEERHVLAYSLPTQRMLAVACGDPVRKVREVARKARGNWAKVV